MIYSWQTEAWESLSRMRARLPHAVLIRAREGTGALEFATEFAQALLCETARPDQACGTCAACNWFRQGNHPDFRLIQPESMAPESTEEETKKEKRSEQIRIDQIRALQDFLAVGTHRGGLRVILVYPAETMNAHTQNALLKSLEEPPPETVFLVVSTQPERLLPTVRSRCLNFPLSLPDPERAAQWLKTQGIADPEATLASVGGAPLAALALAASDDDRSRFLERLRAPGFDPIALAEQCQRISPAEVVTWLQRWSYDLLLSRVSGRIRYHLKDERVIGEISRQCDAVEMAAYLRRLAQAKALARHPLNPKLFFEDLLLQYRRLTGQT